MSERAEKLADRIVAGDRMAAARAITLIENGAPDAGDLLTRLAPHQGKAYRVGITGPPGAGKSTLVDALAREARKRELTVGVVAVDPSSPFTGGALLGDRVRMSASLEDPEVFVRSMASRGTMGGLARSAQEAADVLDAMGKGVIFLETVGVGQSELAVAGSCDTTLVVLVPEAGGMVQALKAGLMEIADLFVVNKSDRPGADELQRHLWDAAGHLERDGWRPPVLKAVAVESTGIGELFDQLLAHRAWLQEGLRLEKKRLSQLESRIRDFVRSRLEERVWSDGEVSSVLGTAAQRLRAGELSLHEAAETVWERVRERLATQDPAG